MHPSSVDRVYAWPQRSTTIGSTAGSCSFNLFVPKKRNAKKNRKNEEEEANVIFEEINCKQKDPAVRRKTVN